MLPHRNSRQCQDASLRGHLRLQKDTWSAEFHAQGLHQGASLSLDKKENIDDILANAPLPKHLINFMKFTFEVVKTNQPHIIASVFTFGREDLIPDMFIEIIKNLKSSSKENLEDLVYYFERHIEVDADEHGPLALEMIKQLCGENEEKWEETLIYSKRALELRINLWDGILDEIQKQNTLSLVT